MWSLISCTTKTFPRTRNSCVYSRGLSACAVLTAGCLTVSVLYIASLKGYMVQWRTKETQDFLLLPQCTMPRFFPIRMREIILASLQSSLKFQVQVIINEESIAILSQLRPSIYKQLTSYSHFQMRHRHITRENENLSKGNVCWLQHGKIECDFQRVRNHRWHLQTFQATWLKFFHV